jgi:lipoprotein signal peptidase
VFLEEYNCGFFLSQFLTLNQFIGLSLFILLLFLFAYFRNIKRSKLSDFGVLLVVLGGLLNLLEWFNSSCVRDYINFFNLFSFNIHDLLVSLGSFFVIIRLWRTK